MIKDKKIIKIIKCNWSLWKIVHWNNLISDFNKSFIIAQKVFFWNHIIFYKLAFGENHTGVLCKRWALCITYEDKQQSTVGRFVRREKFKFSHSKLQTQSDSLYHKVAWENLHKKKKFSKLRKIRHIHISHQDMIISLN